MVEGIEAYTGVTIISANSEMIKHRLVKELGRGITVYKGERGYLPGSFDIKTDCDFDTLLIKAKPDGNVCHTGAETCFNEENSGKDFLRNLEKIIEGRKRRPVSGSYTSTLFKEGMNRMAQKVGEEAVELVIEAKDNNNKLFLNEAADLMFHYLVLLQAKNKMLDDVIEVLEKRHKDQK